MLMPTRVSCFLAIATTITLSPSPVRADEADTALARIRQNKVVTGYRSAIWQGHLPASTGNCTEAAANN